MLLLVIVLVQEGVQEGVTALFFVFFVLEKSDDIVVYVLEIGDEFLFSSY